MTTTTNDPLAPESVVWSGNLFRSLSDGGSWAMPRSGLIFEKRGQELCLRLRMPHDPKMPITAAQLRAQQDADFNVVSQSFGAAGVTVVDKSQS